MHDTLVGGPRQDRWEQIYNEVPLCSVPSHFAGMSNSPFLMQYLVEVLRQCPRGGRTLETGIGSGYGAVWLSLRGMRAEGLDYAAPIVQRARQVNNILGGSARFFHGDLFGLIDLAESDRYDCIHHQGVLEHFSVPRIRAALAQQVACGNRVVFSVPSCNYPYPPEFGDERLLPIEIWRWILEPFDVERLDYYGDPRLGAHEQILCVLRGQPDEPILRTMFKPAPYCSGITGIVHTRNEEARLNDALASLRPFCEQLIVCDMESTDGTLSIAERYNADIIRHPLIANFDQSRNASAMRAEHEWVFYLDADERAPEDLSRALRHAIGQQPEFDALLIPFKHHFTGHWLKCLYPGYTAPRLLRNGKFHFNPRLHSGAVVDGRVEVFPADNPDLALVHYSFDSMSHYLGKLDRYTTGEALNMMQDGQPYHWRRSVSHFVEDFQSYYDRAGAGQDGPHGFIYSFFSAFYRAAQHSKLFEQRVARQAVQPWEQEVPRSVEEVLEYALQVARQKPPKSVPAIRLDNSPAAAGIVWSGPLADPSGYGEESRHLLFALDGAQGEVAAQVIPWSDDEAELTAGESGRLTELAARGVRPGFVQIVHNFPTLWQRHPEARICIGRTTFETDRLPQDWVRACNAMDYVWAPTEFNRRTFADAGVEAGKIVVVPQCLDAESYRNLPPRPLPKGKGRTPYTFLSIFDWTLHKGWDVLLRAFVEGFAADEAVRLVLKVWSTNGYSNEQIREQAYTFGRNVLHHDVEADPRIEFRHERLSADELRLLYCSSDCYVMPSRGEGWGRPLMEAMAWGLPTIATNWSGNTAFMCPDNSYLLDYDLVAVPEVGWREVVTYRGHRWAEPDRGHLCRVMREVVGNPKEAKKVGARARKHILENFGYEAVGRAVAEAVARCAGAMPVALDGHGVTSGEVLADVSRTAVFWEGAFLRWHSLGHVNREICRQIVGVPGIALSLVPMEPNEFSVSDEPRFRGLGDRFFAPVGDGPAVHVRHQFPPRFDRPERGVLVCVSPWEYGFLPEEWIGPITANCDEVWCNSRYVMDVYRNSGIPEERLRLVPLGVDVEIFRPAAPPFVFTTEAGAGRAYPPAPSRSGKGCLTSVGSSGRSAERCGLLGASRPFVFLYVGGTVHRKGIDILLDAYLRAFSASDDVCLVVKDMGTSTVYPDNASARIRDLIADDSRPRIVYLDDNLTPHQLAGIYTAADCIVQPYRGEGFCLPVLEAMACGVPAVVPAGGPTDDFVDESVGWRIDAERRPMADRRVGPWTCVGEPWMFEVDPKALGHLMRSIVANPDEVRARGARASERVRASWTWEHTRDVVVWRIAELSQALTPSPSTSSVRRDVAPLQELVPRAGGVPGGRGRAPRLGASELTTVSTRSEGRSVAGLPGQPTISLCMIVRNEERVLGECLNSIKPWVDEMIVVDTGSHDRTVEIAEGHGAGVYHFPWTDSFSEARNVSLSHATCDWILWMDADDTIPEDCGRKLHDLVLMAEEKTTGIMMQVHIPPAAGEAGFTVVDHVKLFRNGLGLKFEGRIHEQILEPIYKIGGTIVRSDLYVVHSGYDYSPEGQRNKRARDLSLLEKDLADRPDHPFVLFNIGMTAFHMKDFPKAVSALEKCLELSRPGESIVRKVYAMLAGCGLEMHDPIGAKRWIEQGLGLFPRDPELLFRAGAVYRDCGDFAKAEQSYLSLLNEREVGHIDSIDVTMTGFKAHHNLALLYRDTSRVAEAETHFRIALEQAPGFVPSLLGLGEVAYMAGKLHVFDEVMAKLHAIDQTVASEFEARFRK